MNLSSLLLLCIDVQPAFLAAIPDGARVQRRSAFAIAAATGLGIPTIFTEQVPQKLGPTAADLLALVPAPPVVFGKTAFSALADAPTREAVLARQPEHLFLCGIETSVCVYQTALDARAAGLEVTLLSDAVSARRADDAAFCLDALLRAGVHVLPSETVFYALLHDATHPFFKAYTQLVKRYA